MIPPVASTNVTPRQVMHWRHQINAGQHFLLRPVSSFAKSLAVINLLQRLAKQHSRDTAEVGTRTSTRKTSASVRVETSRGH